MKKLLWFYFGFWAILLGWTLLFKSAFVLLEPAYTGADRLRLFSILANGVSMDLSLTAYLAAPVLLWCMAAVWVQSKVMPILVRVYAWITAVIMSLGHVADAMLYPYWGFKLDATPVFYFFTSPVSALASVPWWHTALGIIAIALIAWGIAWTLTRLLKIVLPLRCLSHRITATVIWLILGGLMIIPIRGGVTVSTMAPGRAYFSTEMRLNHAAVNPLFNFLYTATHNDRLDRQFRFISNDQRALVQWQEFLENGKHTPDSISLATMRAISGIAKDNNPQPDVYLIILESFSTHLMPSQGGEPVAMQLDSLAEQGILFTDFYAESFRTDRALATILSGYPALPTTSVFRFASKFGNMPSLARELTHMGYTAKYIYGGDINFTNLGGYLRAAGFSNIISDRDFPLGQKMSKWGANDGSLFTRALEEARNAKDNSPVFTVIQTSSSHEPFDVPGKRHADSAVNAFIYADSCLGAFVRNIQMTSRGKNALIAIVPDHWGAYPRNLQGVHARHHVPFVLTGGALRGVTGKINVPASQSSIAPTILHILSGNTAGNAAFYGGRSLVDSTATYYAWITEPDWFALKTEQGIDSVNINSKFNAKTDKARPAFPFVQLLYKDLDNR